MPPPRLSLATFNLHYGVKPARRPPAEPYDVEAALRAFDADVIVLQEVWRPDRRRGPTDEAADALGYELHYETTGAASVPVEALTQLYLDEGAAEGVKGDVAFIQAVVETGWFRFGGSVPAWKNNFAGLGATDSNPSPAAFPDARTGVRAQIQHLRAYADAGATSCTTPPLHRPCADPRFALVVPKGKAPTWNQMGNGNWATSSTYATSILNLYNEARGYR